MRSRKIPFRPREDIRESKEWEAARLDTALELARLAQAAKIGKLMEEGYEGEDISARVSSLNEIADYYYRVHRDLLDRIIASKLNEPAPSPKAPQDSSEFDEETDNLSTNFESYFEAKKEALEAYAESEGGLSGGGIQEIRGTGAESEGGGAIQQEIGGDVEVAGDAAGDATQQDGCDTGDIEVGELESSEKEEYESERKIGEIQSTIDFEAALAYHPELMLKKDYQNKRYDADSYFELKDALENGSITSDFKDLEQFSDKHDIPSQKASDWTIKGLKPSLISELEYLECRRLYETHHGSPPKIKIEDMKDLEELLKKHPDIKEDSKFSSRYKESEIYFEVKGNFTMTREELSKKYKMGHTRIGYMRLGVETGLVSELRHLEEDRIIKKWADSLSREEIDYLTRDNEMQPRYNQGFIHPIKLTDNEFDEQMDLEKQLVQLLKDSVKESHEQKARMTIADLSSLSQEKMTDFKEQLDNKDSIEKLVDDYLKTKVDNNSELKLSLVDEKLYIWTPNRSHEELINAYGDQYFYFNDRNEFASFLDNVRTSVGLDNSLHNSVKHFNEVLDGFNLSPVSGKGMSRSIDTLKARLSGDSLHFLLDASDIELSELEGRISKVTAPNGLGGIENPKFPTGEEYEILRARLIATVVSAGQIRADTGRIGYSEQILSRSERVQEILNGFGDIEMVPYHREGKNEYIFPCVLGRALWHWELTSGDKTIVNSGLPDFIENGTWRVRAAYLQELIPEDGSFHKNTGFRWTRYVAIDAGDKNEMYKFPNEVSSDIIGMIKENGTHVGGLVPQVTLTKSTLEELGNSEDSSLAKSASNLLSMINERPSKLIHDESRIAESLGIETRLGPSTVKFYPKTGKVTVRWNAGTTKREDGLRWAIIAPPNDERKRANVKKWLLSKEKYIPPILCDLGRRGYTVSEWWK